MTKSDKFTITRSKKILIAILVAWSIAFFQYSLDRRKYMRLKNDGIIVSATSSYKKQRDADYVHFCFTTIGKVKICRYQKCGSKQTFDEQYANMNVIYNPKNPDEFENLYDFERRGIFREFFFLLLYPLFITIFLLALIRIVSKLYHFFKT